jgi:hypothetical protein
MKPEIHPVEAGRLVRLEGRPRTGLFPWEVVLPFGIDGTHYFPDPGEGAPDLLETSYLNPR